MRHSCPDIADIHTGLSFPQSWDHSVSAASGVEQTTLTLCLLCPTSSLLTQSSASDRYHIITPGPQSSSATVPRVPAKYNALEIINI